MNPLQSRQVKAFSEALEMIHAETDLAQFPQRVFEVVESLIPNVVVSLDELNTRTGAGRTAVNRPVPPSAEWRDRLRDLVPLEHPAFPAVLAGARQALQISDFVTQRQFQRTALFHDVFRPLAARHQILLPLVVPGHVAGITISRWEEFQPDEMAIAQMLGPHIALAHVHAQTLTELRQLHRQPSPGPESFLAIGLTPRQSEILHWVVQGKRDGEIAQIVGASPRTVQKHVQSILARLGVETRTAAALEAVHAVRRKSSGHVGAEHPAPQASATRATPPT
jgi:DNA-binding CsgD family transcriptional regulator